VSRFGDEGWAVSPTAELPLGARLRDVLTASDYTEEGIPGVLGPPLHLGFHADREVLLRRLGEDRTATLVKLFYLGEPVPREVAARAIAPLELRDLAHAMLIEGGLNDVRPLARISPHEGLLLASDPPGGIPRPDFVTGANQSAATLARLTIRREIDSTLDLGMGCGIQGLLATRHSAEVVGVDINPRAVAFAEFNAGLNGVSNFESRLGNWFEPVAGQRFDLILANPPYAVSPDTDFGFRDSDMPGDEISRWTIGQIPGHLAEGGFGHVICNWVHDEDWREPLEASLRGRGCDAVLLHYHTADPAEYAASWNHPFLETDLPAFKVALDRWLDYYRRAGITGIAWGMVVLRRRSSGSNWVRAIEVPSRSFGAAGQHLERLFTGKDYLQGLTDDGQLLDQVFVQIEGTRFHERSEWIDGERRFETPLVKLSDGVGFAGRISPQAVEVVTRCDGQRRLGEIVEEASAELGMEPGEVRTHAVAAVKRLVELGLLAPPVD
jgi:methylase of polypeptide subunit release factors